MNIIKWLIYIKNNIRLPVDGFFELPYLANSPQIMVESTINAPTSKHNVTEQSISRDNIFTKGTMRYREIEPGFWIVASHIDFKKNVLIKTVYDDDFISNYYTLTFTIFENQVQLQNTFEDKVPFSSKYWGFKKPGVPVGAYMFKESKGQFYVYAFSEDWIKKNRSFDALSDKNSFKKFLDSKNGFITYQDIVPKAETLSYEVWNTLRNFNDNNFSKTLLKSQTLSLVTTFFKNAIESDRNEVENFESELDYKKIAKSEKLIIDCLTTSFLGIETIAQQVNMSPSKLKTSFKSVYGTSMKQYHIDKKMQLALQLIQNTDLPIKNITFEVGYESASKFSATFKKYFNKLPSEFRISD